MIFWVSFHLYFLILYKMVIGSQKRLIFISPQCPFYTIHIRNTGKIRIVGTGLSEREDIPRTETEVVGMLFDEKDLKSNRKKKNSKKSKGKLLRTLCDSGTSDNVIKCPK